MIPLLSKVPAQLGPVGGPELVVIFLVLLLLIGVPVAIVFIVLAIVKRNKQKSAPPENTHPPDQPD